MRRPAKVFQKNYLEGHSKQEDDDPQYETNVIICSTTCLGITSSQASRINVKFTY
jgi:hypothetical protein